MAQGGLDLAQGCLAQPLPAVVHQCHDRNNTAEGEPMRATLNELLLQLVQRGWPKVDGSKASIVLEPVGPWWSIDVGCFALGNVTTVTLHPWREGLLDFSITVLVDGDDTIQSFELECNAMPVPVALINWWGGLDVALSQASALKDHLVSAWGREISAGGELP